MLTKATLPSSCYLMYVRTVQTAWRACLSVSFKRTSDCCLRKYDENHDDKATTGMKLFLLFSLRRRFEVSARGEGSFTF